MSTTETKPWLIDGRTGATSTYGELLDAVNRGAVRPLCQPASTRDALLEIAMALAHGAELTLFDRDFSGQELAALGFSREAVDGETVNRRQTDWPQEGAKDARGEGASEPAGLQEGGTGKITLEALMRAAAGGSQARLGLFTSGSTGLPKLVWQTAANLSRTVRVSPRHAEAVWAFAYNPTHMAGIQVYLQALANGSTLVDVYGLERAAVLAAIERHGITHISATPSFYRLLLPVEHPLSGVRSVTLGGESSDAKLLDRLRGLFPNARFHNIYASTEAGALLAAEGDVFAIAAGLEDKVAVRDGRLRVHRSLLGEFANAAFPTPPVTGDQLSGIGSPPTEKPLQPTSNFQQQITNTPEPTTSAAAADWYDTGDVVEIVSEAPLRFRIVARERDWVNVGGSKVNPREVEAVLEEHPLVRQARVFGRTNSVTGHLLCAEIVAEQDQRPGTKDQRLTEAELREWLGARLQPFKVPRLIRFVDDIAQTRTGKVSRSDGRQWTEDR